MPTVIALLRAVNVGGRNKIKMEALRDLFGSLGFRDARTYVQSGNIVFGASARNLAALAAQIESALESAFGFRPDVILRTAAELRHVAARNPFPSHAATDPNRVAVFFLAAELAAEARARALALKCSPEQLHLAGREVYVYFPNGIGQSKLPARLDSALKVPTTARNWNTVVRLLELAGSE